VEPLSKSKLNRRKFLKLSAAGAVSLSSGIGGTQVARAQDGPFTPLDQPGRVVRVEHAGALADPTRVGSDPVPEVVESMVDTAMLAFTGQSDIGAAWAQFISLDDRVMIKINALGSPLMATNKPVVEAIIRGLTAMGLPLEQMLVYDQYGSRMRRAGFRPGREIMGVPIEFNNSEGYEEVATPHGDSGESHFAVSLEACTAVINVPVIKDHDICGITMAFKNMTHGVIDTPSRLHRRHRDTRCAVHAEVYGHAKIRDKVRVIVADGLRVMYDGGPQDNEHKEVHNSIYVATDPVAMDTCGVDAVEAARERNGLDTLAEDERSCDWLEVCAEAGLGVHDRSAITLEHHVLS
jgi:uncharacterized protein (DUF362 family)